jgi:hypothetical protein
VLLQPAAEAAQDFVDPVRRGFGPVAVVRENPFVQLGQAMRLVKVRSERHEQAMVGLQRLELHAAAAREVGGSGRDIERGLRA